MKTNERAQIIQTGIDEAERFIKKAKGAIKRIKEEAATEYGCIATKETGAVKRAALDLKRVLTDINQMKSY